MTTLLWWLIPIGAVAATLGLFTLIRYLRKPKVDVTDQYAQLRRAMTKDLPGQRPSDMGTR
ncbi:MAG: hypothetical protein RJB01_1595 [Actinomycetota bacterium]|jgi:cytochrome c-type biogenesis protein CcmH/NrfF